MSTLTFEELLAIKNKNADKLLRIQGVTGVDVGLKVVGGIKTDELAIVVYVKKKHAVPSDQEIPQVFEGAPTDVVEREFVLTSRGTVKARSLVGIQSSRVDPLLGGVSVGPCGENSAGTLTCSVIDIATQDPMLLSCFHVFASNNVAQAGDDITQPSRIDNGRCSQPTTIIGFIDRWLIGGGWDCAVARQSPARGHQGNVVNVAPLFGSGDPGVGTVVCKMGRTTDFTTGRIESTTLTIQTDYGPPIGTLTFNNVVEIYPDPGFTNFLEPGDSGAPLINSLGWAVGMCFARDSRSPRGYALPLTPILMALGVRLDTPPWGSHWIQMPKTAQDIAIGASGHIWMCGNDDDGVNGGVIYKWDGNGAWLAFHKRATRIAVAPDGTPWVVDRTGKIFRRVEGGWERLPGGATDIAIGPEGSVWICGLQGDGVNGYGIYKWDNRGRIWKQIDGLARRVAVDDIGSPWVVNSLGGIFRRVGNAWQQIPGGARDIAIGKNGAIWIVGTEDMIGTGGIVYRYDRTRWVAICGAGSSLTVDPNGVPWVVNRRGGIFKRI